jgi:hypothetical protein
LKIFRSLIGHKHISLEAAKDLINNPREGSCTFPFKKAKGKKPLPTSKRQKLNNSGTQYSLRGGGLASKIASPLLVGWQFMQFMFESSLSKSEYCHLMQAQLL